jgi:hypothetical protein
MIDMTKLLFLWFAILALDSSAQKNIESTDHISLDGQVKNKLSFSLKDLEAFPSKKIDSIVIYSHLMEPRRTIRNLRGVLLKDIIDKAGIDSESPKLLSEYYITCIASDNYKVVYSWNEIFNGPNGESIIIIIEADGKKADQITDRIAMLCAADKATGRRYVKGLRQIMVSRVK